jgi:hypothetical protein
MKKMTAMVLALGLAVPAQAWHLFPVRKEILTVKVKETNYAVTAATFVITLVASLIAGKLMFNPKKLSAEDKELADNSIIDKFLVKLTPYLNNKYGVSLAVDCSDMQSVTLSKNGKDLNEDRRNNYLETVRDVVRTFNDRFNLMGIYMEATIRNGVAYKIKFGSPICQDFSDPLSDGGITRLVRTLQRIFLYQAIPHTDDEAEQPQPEMH